MNGTVVSNFDVSTDNITTLSETTQNDRPTTEAVETTGTLPQLASMNGSEVQGIRPTRSTEQDMVMFEPTTSTDNLPFKEIKWTSEMILLTVILCGAFLIVCLLVGWTTSVVYLKSRHRKRIRQLMETYQDSKSKGHRPENVPFTPLGAWPQDMEFQTNTSHNNLYARVKRTSIALEEGTLHSMGLTTFTRPSREEVTDTPQLYTQSQSPLLTFHRSPDSVYQRVSTYAEDHQSESQF